MIILKKITSVLILGFILCSCSALLSKMYGVKKLKNFNTKEYQSFKEDVQKQLPSAVFIVSTSDLYKKNIQSGKDSIERHDLGQPVQILYFENHVLRSYHVNCYTKGSLSNLNWNTDNRFASFLPKSAVNCEKEVVSLKRYAEIYSEIDMASKKPYTILVFWTNMLRKISMSAITTMADNLKQHQQENNCNIYIINTDNFFIEHQ